MDIDRIQEIVKSLLVEINEDPNREGLQRTPLRVAKSWKTLTEGYQKDPMEVLGQGTFESYSEEMVVVCDIDFYSLCEHHLLPFFGKVHIAYLPNQKIIGLSKLPRLVDVFARRLQVQERMTEEISKTIEELLQPKGVAVVVEAQHLCMMMRGVQKQNSYAITSSVQGSFRDQPETRAEFMKLIHQRRS